MNKNIVKHIYFDLDNTLWDHRRNSILVLEKMFHENEITQKIDISFDEWHDVFYQKNEILWAKLRDKEITKEQLREQRFKKAFEFFDVQDDALADFFEENYLKEMNQMSEVVPGATELVDYLKSKYQLHIITNGFEEVSAQKIENAGMASAFQTLTCADEINVRKPDARIFEYAVAKANAKPQESLLIGDDWIADVIGATEFGMQAIFLDLLNENFQRDGVPVVKHLAEIHALL